MPDVKHALARTEAEVRMVLTDPDGFMDMPARNVGAAQAETAEDSEETKKGY
jgi:hypothetical protein